MILKDTRKPFTPAPEGLHQAVCVDFIDLGEMDGQWGKKPKCEIRWQIDSLMDNGDRFIVHQRYTASLNEKATLRKILESWRGRKFTPKELEGFDSENLIGANCQLQIVHVQGTKDPTATFANVQAIVPIGRNTAKIQPLDYERVKDRVTPEEPGAVPVQEAEEVPF